MRASNLSPPAPSGWLKAFLITVATTGLAALLSLAAAPAIHATPFMLLSGAVVVSVWFGGFPQGLLSVILGGPFAYYYLLVPRETWWRNPGDLVRTAIWASFASLVAFVLGKLRESESRARSVLANVAEGFCILDYSWNFVYINSFGAELAGLSKEEIIGQHLWKLFPEMVGTPAEQQYLRCATERVNVQFETPIKNGAGWLQVRAHPFPDGICVFFQDISEARQNEERLRSVLDRLAVAHKAAQMGTWDWNIKTNDLIWSEEIPRIHGLSPEEFDGKLETWLKTIHPQDLERVQASIQRTLETKEDYCIEFRVVFPNGEIRWVSGHGRVIVDEQGVPVRMVGIGADATHRHHEEEALLRSEKLAAAGRLAATIAHEINNPLEAVTNLVYLIRQDRSVQRETQELLRMVDEQLARVNHIARQTLGFSHDRALPETVDVAQLFEELLLIFQSRLVSRQLHVEKEYGNVARLDAFKADLRQVLSNLLANAIDASSLGSKLILRIKREAWNHSAGMVRLEVEDFGTGISPGNQSRIFEPFFTTKSDVGTGLGLWVSRQIVEKHGGNIEFRTSSEQGHSGTCFSVVLPANHSARRASAQLQ